MGKILKFPMKEQLHNFDCGVAVAWATLRYYGEKPHYLNLIKGSGVCPVDGLNPYMLMDLLRHYGLYPNLEENKSIRYIKNEIMNDRPVITVVQMRKEYNRPWSKTWSYGHYVTVIGFDNTKLFLYDPWIGGIRSYKNEMFYNRWHDCSPEGDKYIKTCITIDN